MAHPQHGQNRKLKLGTRRSLLARAQSGWVAREIERLNLELGVQVELVGIDTRGDKILDVPLSQVEGKEFFVAELDHALAKGEVDFTVHSLKDLSLERPSQFKLAAIPARQDPRDLIIFSPLALTRWHEGKELKVGTSSPRRLQNLPPFLKQALPRRAHSAASPFKFEQIRGNINTRLSRLHEAQDSDRYLDAVVLALAGLNRLCVNQEALTELKTLTQGVRFMVLPLTEFPTAPGQGALAVECRADDVEVFSIVSKLHDAKTHREILAEREVLIEQGGGCHQRFGATSLELEGLGATLFIKGTSQTGKILDQVRWKRPAIKSGPYFSVATQNHFNTLECTANEKSVLNQPGALFVAHWRAIDSERAKILAHTPRRIWVPGTSSWFKLAEQGIWVEGCSEGLGFEFILNTLQSPALALPSFLNWTVLTHDRAKSSWDGHSMGQIFSTYQVNLNPDAVDLDALQHAGVVYWGSAAQFEALKDHVKTNVIHCCGAGKTAQTLQKNGLKPLLFPNREEWELWTESK